MEDADTYAMGNWSVKEGKEDEFLSRWREFLEWTRGNAAGFQQAFLLRNQDEPRHFRSYSTWDDPTSQQQWRTLPEFEQKLGACRALCDDFESGAYKRVLTIS
jgi:heme-degrading monooxygenase HmoA